MTRVRQGFVAMFLAASLLAAGPANPVRANGTGTPKPDADAARLVEEVLRKAGGDDGESLGAWTRSILDRALDRAGETARQTVPGSPLSSAPPLPAERHAGQLTGPHSGTAEVLIFTSLSVPPRAGGNGRATRPGRARRWCCAAWAKAAGPRPRSGSASALAGWRPAPDRGPGQASPSTRACSACSVLNGCPPWSSCRAACRPAKAGAARTIRLRRMTASPATSA